MSGTHVRYLRTAERKQVFDIWDLAGTYVRRKRPHNGDHVALVISGRPHLWLISSYGTHFRVSAIDQDNESPTPLLYNRGLDIYAGEEFDQPQRDALHNFLRRELILDVLADS